MISAQQLWDGLRRVRAVRFASRSSLPGWDGMGIGSVVVDSPSLSVLVYNESGAWHSSNGRETRFTNVFRWTLGSDESVKLEHLRFGPDHPVYLFDLAPDADDRWVSVKPHACDQDCYEAELRVQESGLWVCWVVTGPKKNERIEYTYSW